MKQIDRKLFNLYRFLTFFFAISFLVVSVVSIKYTVLLSKINKTERNQKTICKVATKYYSLYNKLPKNLKEIKTIRPGKDVPEKDPWGNRWEIIINHKQDFFCVKSFGPNGQRETRSSDDLVECVKIEKIEHGQALISWNVH